MNIPSVWQGAGEVLGDRRAAPLGDRQHPLILRASQPPFVEEVGHQCRSQAAAQVVAAFCPVETLPGEGSAPRPLGPDIDAHPIAADRSDSGRFEPVWTIEVQTLPEVTDRIRSTPTSRHSLPVRPRRIRWSNARPPSSADPDVLAAVMGAGLRVHHYEEPVVFRREDSAGRAAYDPGNTDPHRWWNKGRGLPGRLE